MYKYSNCMVLRLPLEILCQICSLIPMTDVTQLCRASPKLAQLIYNMPHLWREITVAMQPLTNTSQALAYSQKQTSKVLNDIPDRLAQRLLSTLLSREARNGIRTVTIIDHAKFFFQQDDSRLHEMMQLVFRQCPNLVHFTLQTSSDIDYYSLIDSLNEIPPCSAPKQFQLPRLSKFELIETHRPRPLLNTIVLAEIQHALSNLTPHPAFSQKSCKECREYIGYQQPMCAQCLTSQPEAIRCPFCHWQCDDCGAHFCDGCQKKELVEVLLADYHGDTLRYNHSEHTSCPPSNPCPNGSGSSNTTLLCSRCVQAHKCNKCEMLFASENLRHCDICQQQSFCSSISDESLTIPEPTRAVPLITSVHTIYRDTPSKPTLPSHNLHQLTTARRHSASQDNHSSESSDEEDEDDEDDMGCCRFTEKFIRCKQCKMTGFCTQCLPQAREGIRNWVTVCPTCDEFICPLCVAEGRLPLFFAPGYGTSAHTT
ncbi:hypothetical protein K450DRAFT_248290 [Umbelopsis ramanniana AG]|uniref:F-box domain-containing protein n=1 Tax=Umbelopsis ramanniana AG TaxID=1314678 RepID=A0AAD5E6S3_UMBRA|nr:uncharacterized protein K450DRAFT_248290 [Umbelopsis ramanniana AG]KAI8578138.1 hypothetical protein K450DRAFT_248290 [Umbelopsis ramanniana AG]